MPRWSIIFLTGCLLAAPAFALDLPDFEIHHEKTTGKVISIINKTVTSPKKGEINIQAAIIARVHLDSKEKESLAIQAADSFLAEKGSLLGIKNVAAELHPQGFSEDKIGNMHVSYQQQLNGVAFCDQEILAHLNSNNEVKSVNGDFAPNINIDTRPKVKSARALRFAKKNIEKRHGWKRALSIERRSARKGCRNSRKYERNQALCVNKRMKRFESAKGFDKLSDPKLCIESKDGNSSLIWKLSLADGAGALLGHYKVDARTGRVLHFDDGETHLRRSVYDCSWPPEAEGGPCVVNKTYFVEGYGDYTFGRRESDPPVGANPRPLPYLGSTDVDDAHEIHIPSVHEYYLNIFGRDGGNNQGGTGNGSGLAPYDLTMFVVNADNSSSGQVKCKTDEGTGWTNGYSLFFCRGSLTNDLIAHEYQHIVSKYMRQVNGSYISLGESHSGGTLNEHISDLMGEAYEAEKNGTGIPNWLAGGNGNVPVVRNLANPPELTYAVAEILGPSTTGPYPDRFHAPSFYCGEGNDGGEHVNSTVPSKAAYLASEGGEFNGCTIEGIGIRKVEQIWYRALTTYFTADTSFNAAASYFNQACDDLANPPVTFSDLVPPFTITPDDCDQVKAALQAVEMDQAGFCSGLPPEIPECAVQEPELPGDCDGNGLVDDNDYLAWKSSFNAVGPALPCDFNADGVVDAADYTIWRDNYGAGS